MQLNMFKSKIHRATVTHAELHYEGSLTIPRDLMARADILPYERVSIWNVTRGSRLDTYAIEGEAGDGIICANGAAAHHIHPGDVIIIATFAEVDDSEARDWKPTVVLVDAHNRVKDAAATEVPGPRVRAV